MSNMVTAVMSDAERNACILLIEKEIGKRKPTAPEIAMLDKLRNAKPAGEVWEPVTMSVTFDDPQAQGTFGGEWVRPAPVRKKIQEWEPSDDFQESDKDGVLLTVNDNSDFLEGGHGYSIVLETTRGEHKVLGYNLPDNIRLCRKVEAK